MLIALFASFFIFIALPVFCLVRFLFKLVKYIRIRRSGSENTILRKETISAFIYAVIFIGISLGLTILLENTLTNM